jgi:hypothetical protein
VCYNPEIAKYEKMARDKAIELAEEELSAVDFKNIYFFLRDETELMLTRDNVETLINLCLFSITTWIIDLPSKYNREQFPFVLPLVTIYERIMIAKTHLAHLEDKYPDVKNNRWYKELIKVIQVCDNASVKKLSALIAKIDHNIFLRVRTALADGPHKDKLNALYVDFHNCAKKELEKYYTIAANKLKRELSVLVPDIQTSIRTNNLIEANFRSEKQKIRKVTGKRVVSREMRYLADIGGLLSNMTNKLYLAKILPSPVDQLRKHWHKITQVISERKEARSFKKNCASSLGNILKRLGIYK